MKLNRTQSYNNIFIIGMPGCGKSTFGKIYSHFSGRQFIDFDSFLESSLNTKISKIFATQGLEGFRKLETQVLRSLEDKSGNVISLGGGTLLSQENFTFAKQHGLIVALTGLPVLELSQRLWQDKNNSKVRKRPLFAHCQNFEQIVEKVNEISKKRNDSYLKADIILNQDFNSTDTLVLSLLEIEKQFHSH